MEKNKSNTMNLRKFYTLLMIIVPSILLVVVSQGMQEFLTRSIAQIILFVWQVIAVKGVLDDYFIE